MYLVCLFARCGNAGIYYGRGPVLGQTPCCVDRLTTIICLRQKQLNPASFLHKCMRNPDFAFVQCCRSCFDQKLDDTYQLDYARTSELLLTNPVTAVDHCFDRRGLSWCNLFAHKKLSWQTQHSRRRMDCSNVPVAFRLCRKSCGFCATGEQPAHALYDYTVAHDAYRCYNPANSLAQRKANMKSVYHNFADRFTNKSKTITEYISSGISRSAGNQEEELPQHSSDDYFVVADHDYDVEGNDEGNIYEDNK